MVTRVRLLLAAFALGTATSVALAEPVTLTEIQMDRVTAGAEVTNEPGHFRYEEGNAIVEMKGHEGLAEYEVVETEGGSTLHVVVPSDGTKMVVPLSGGGTPVAVSLPSDKLTVTIPVE